MPSTPGWVTSPGEIARIEPCESESLSSTCRVEVRPGTDLQVVRLRLGRRAAHLVVDEVLVLLLVLVVGLRRRDDRVPVVDLDAVAVDVPDVTGVEVVEDDEPTVDAQLDAVGAHALLHRSEVDRVGVGGRPAVAAVVDVGGPGPRRVDAARETHGRGEEEPLARSALAQLHATGRRAVAGQGDLRQLRLVLDEDGRRVGARLLERGEGGVAGLGVADRQLLRLGERVGVELAGGGVPDDPVAADRRHLRRLRREAELRRDRLGEGVALGPQQGDRAHLGGHGIHRAVDADGDGGVAAHLRERLGLGLQGVEAR